MYFGKVKKEKYLVIMQLNITTYYHNMLYQHQT